MSELVSDRLLIPVKSWTDENGAFTWPAMPVVTSPRLTDKLPLEQLAQDLQARYGLKPCLEFRAGVPCSLWVTRDAGITNPEAYRIHITSDGIEITSSGDAGVYYAIQTLREMIRCRRSAPSLPAVRIEDEPDFQRRGVYLDCARGKPPKVKTLKALVERLASWKINEFQLYIKNGFKWNEHPDIGRGHSPYSPSDMLAVQEHCKKHHIRFIPSLATLSHNELTLQLPRYRHLAELPGAMGWEGGTMLCPTDPGSITLVEELYREFLPLFEADEVNVCCDEPWELGKGRSADAAEKQGAGRVYLNFLLKVYELCERFGKRMNMWGDIVLEHSELIPEFPKDVVMLNWDYAPHGKRMPRTSEFTNAGIPVVVCPGTQSWQRHGTDLPSAIANVSNFAAIGRENGALGLLNTDWGDFGHRNPLGVSLHGYAHGAAQAWHGAAVDDNTFTDLFAAQVFGDVDGKLAEDLRTLGRTAERVSDMSTCLYHALVEPLQPPHTRFIEQFDPVSEVLHYPASYPDAIHRAAPQALKEAIADLESVRFEAAGDAAVHAFERDALDDCCLAVRMDRVAAVRALLAQSLRSGTPVESRQWKRYISAMQQLVHDFEANWRARNRPGLLRDNLKLMRCALDEAIEQSGQA